MEMQEMEITIDKEGRIQVKVNGAHGADCLAMTKNLEEAAGVVEERAFSPAYTNNRCMKSIIPVSGDTKENYRARFRTAWMLPRSSLRSSTGVSQISGRRAKAG